MPGRGTFGEMRAVAILLWLLPGVAGATECRLALLLALDVSSSVDAEEDRLQRDGLAAALVAPEVAAAFLRGAPPVAVAAYEWSGRWNQKVLSDWRLIRSEADLSALSAAIATSRRSSSDSPTALGYGLGFGARMLREGPDCLFRTLDVAGDGINNEGFGPAIAYEAFPFDGVTVNGLAVAAPGGDEAMSVEAYYEAELKRGPLAFVEVAQGFEDFERAMRRKLERELAAPAVGALGDGRGGWP